MCSQPTPSSEATGPAPANLLITGCYRSGTTLLEKLLHSHRNVCLASQPFPVLYFHVKSLFLAELGLQRRYPLDHLFREEGYARDEFHAFLDRFRLCEERLDAVFDGLAEYTLGLWTPEITRFRDMVTPGVFIDIYRQMNGFVPLLFPKEDIRYVGGKEVLCEEYVPYLLSRGHKAIIVIRDPRDMITSLNFRERDNLTGANRPVLFSLRAWRKSVAIALAHENHPDFKWVRYEDLARDPRATLCQLASFLGVDGFRSEMFKSGIRDQRGDPWRGNSSFEEQDGISTGSVGRYVTVLPEYVTAYVEACCWPEMRLLGYDFRDLSHFEEDAVRSYREPFEVLHHKFPPDYSFSTEHIEEEIERYRKLAVRAEPLSVEEARQWFLYRSTYRKLCL
jgi:hypothetical protein